MLVGFPKIISDVANLIKRIADEDGSVFGAAVKYKFSNHIGVIFAVIMPNKK